MYQAETSALEGEILEERVPDPEAREVTPGWVTRNRDLITRGQAVARSLIIIAPPPARLALAAAAAVADGVLLATDFRRGLVDLRSAGVRAGGIALEGATIMAATRFAPRIFAQHHHKILMARSVWRRLNPSPCT